MIVVIERRTGKTGARLLNPAGSDDHLYFPVYKSQCLTGKIFV